MLYLYKKYVLTFGQSSCLGLRFIQNRNCIRFSP